MTSIRSALWVTPEVPDRSLGGGNVRQAHLLAALATKVPTTLVTVGRVEDKFVRDGLCGVLELTAVPGVPPRPRWRRRVAQIGGAVIDPLPSDIAIDRPLWKRLLPELHAAAAFDLVCIEHARLAPFVSCRTNNAWTLTMHNVPSEEARQARDLATRRRDRWLHGRDRSKALRFERQHLPCYDLVIAVSRDDAALLPEGTHVTVVPNGVDVSQYVPAPLLRPARLVFTGTLDYPPNVDGVRWFCHAVLPRIAARVPEVTFDIVGRRAVPAVRSLARDRRVRVVGDVQTTIPYLHAARVAVVPVRFGTGTRVKALEAMAAGRPVVGTTVGLAGLGLRNGVDVHVADRPEDFADRVVALMDDDDDALRMARTARQVVEHRFAWARIGARYADAVLSAAMAQRAAAPGR